MKLWKKVTLMLTMTLLIMIPAISAVANAEPRAASRYCSRCEEMTPFVDCELCALLPNPNIGSTPYHCNVCGATYRTTSTCPRFRH